MAKIHAKAYAPNSAPRRASRVVTALPPSAPPPPRITFGTPEIHGGHWSIEGEDLIQTDLAEPNATIIFGDPA